MKCNKLIHSVFYNVSLHVYKQLSHKCTYINNSMIPSLARVFGYYECKRCQNYWTSADTWNVVDTSGEYMNDHEMYLSPTTNVTVKTYYRQNCSYCNNNIFPYKTTPLLPNPKNGQNNRKQRKSQYRMKQIQPQVQILVESPHTQFTQDLEQTGEVLQQAHTQE